MVNILSSSHTYFGVFLHSAYFRMEIPLMSLLLSTAIIMILFTAYAYFRRDINGAKSYSGFCLSVAIYSLFYAFELFSLNLDQAMLWNKLQYIGIASMPAFGVIFILQITSNSRLIEGKRMIIPWIIPLATIILKFTEHYHQWIYSDVQAYQRGHLLILEITEGWWYWVNVSYLNFILILAVILLIRAYFYRPKLSVGQTFCLIAGIIAPWVGHLIYIFNIGLEGIDFSPVTFVISSICFGVAIFYYRVLSISPVARDHIFMSIRDGIIVLDNNDMIIDYNLAAQKIFGLSQKRMPGIYPSNIFSAFPSIMSFLGSDDKEKTIAFGEGADEYIYIARQCKLYSLQKKDMGRTITFWDITKRQKVERELNEAREMAEIANITKSEFVANMSHEIRTPMTAILGFSDILYKQIEDPQRKTMAQSINSSGKLLLALLDDILDLAKIEAGKIDMTSGPVNIKVVLEEIEMLFSQKAREKGLEFKLQISDRLPQLLLLNEIRLKQLLLNLTGNAVKFTSKGSVTIYAGYIVTNANLGTLTIDVIDTGIGISQEHIKVIFKPFKQMQGQSNREYGGTGLGLTISMKLIEKMKGSIKVQSKVGEGTKFTVLLPEIKAVSSDEGLRSSLDKQIDNKTFVSKTPSVPNWVAGDEILEPEHLKYELNSNFVPRWEQLKDQLIIFKIEEFAADLYSLATKHQSAILADYAGKLTLHASRLDIEKLKEAMKKFLDIVSELEYKIQ